MADRLTPEKRSWNMSRIRSSNTTIELKVREYLFSHGFRYRLRTKLPGHPDLVFINKKIAVFVNGCFWHYHSCKLSKIPGTRKDFWGQKLRKNKKRDSVVEERLRKEGWTVCVIWECQIESGLEKAISPLTRLLEK